MKNKNNLDTLLQKELIDARQFPIDFFFTELVEIQIKERAKEFEDPKQDSIIEEKNTYNDIHFSKYDYSGQVMWTPQKPISTILEPIKIIL